MSAKRKELALRALRADDEIRRLQRAQADTLAGLLRDRGPEVAAINGPDRVDLIGPEEPDEELDDWEET